MLLTTEMPAKDKGSDGKKLQELSLRGKSAKQREKQKKIEEEKDKLRGLKKTYIIELARKIQNLSNDDINTHLREVCLRINRENKKMFNKLNIGILVLLKYWGDPKSLALRYIEEEESKERKIKEAEERQIEQQKEMERKKREEANLELVELKSNLRGETGK